MRRREFLRQAVGSLLPAGLGLQCASHVAPVARPVQACDCQKPAGLLRLPSSGFRLEPRVWRDVRFFELHCDRHGRIGFVHVVSAGELAASARREGRG